LFYPPPKRVIASSAAVALLRVLCHDGYKHPGWYMCEASLPGTTGRGAVARAGVVISPEKIPLLRIFRFVMLKARRACPVVRKVV
jgi:hypothetical protein